MNDPKRIKNDPQTTPKQDNPHKPEHVGSSIEFRHPEDLTPHPKNTQIVPALEGDDEVRFCLRVLVDGEIRNALEILPDGQILCGRQRWKAAVAAELERVPVIVRHDLVGDEDAQVERIVLENYERKSFTEGQRVRQLLHVAEIRRRNAALRKAATQFGTDGPGKFAGTGDVREEMARLAKVSPRTWDKAVVVLTGEAPFAALYEAGHLSASRAHMLLDVPTETQEAIREQVMAAEVSERRGLARDLTASMLRTSQDAAEPATAAPEAPAGKAPTPAEQAGESPPVRNDVERIHELADSLTLDDEAVRAQIHAVLKAAAACLEVSELEACEADEEDADEVKGAPLRRLAEIALHVLAMLAVEEESEWLRDLLPALPVLVPSNPHWELPDLWDEDPVAWAALELRDLELMRRVGHGRYSRRIWELRRHSTVGRELLVDLALDSELGRQLEALRSLAQLRSLPWGEPDQIDVSRLLPLMSADDPNVRKEVSAVVRTHADHKVFSELRRVVSVRGNAGLAGRAA